MDITYVQTMHVRSKDKTWKYSCIIFLHMDFKISMRKTNQEAELNFLNSFLISTNTAAIGIEVGSYMMHYSRTFQCHAVMRTVVN